MLCVGVWVCVYSVIGEVELSLALSPTLTHLPEVASWSDVDEVESEGLHFPVWSLSLILLWQDLLGFWWPGPGHLLIESLYFLLAAELEGLAVGGM